MSEPEDVLLEGAHTATTAALRLWRRRTGGPGDTRKVELQGMRRRLELFVATLFDVAPPIRSADPPAPPTWISRVATRIPRHLIRRTALAATDGTAILLPRAITVRTTIPAAEATYRLLALEQAIRLVRGTATVAADLGRRNGEPVNNRDVALLKDLFLIAEAAAVDRFTAAEFPGILPILRSARQDALDDRPRLEWLTESEQWVERLIRMVLRESIGGEESRNAKRIERVTRRARPSDVGARSAHASPQQTEPAASSAVQATNPPLSTPSAGSPADSLVWAHEVLTLLPRTGRYRGLPPVWLWGEVVPPSGHPVLRSGAEPITQKPPPQSRIAKLERRPRVREAASDEDDPGPGIWMVPIDDPEEKAEDPFGLQRPTDRDDLADPDELAESLAELPEARLVATPGQPREVLVGDDPPDRKVSIRQGEVHPGKVVYPEWDWRIGAYRGTGAVVQVRPAPLGDPGWARDLLDRRAALVRQVRRRFERLRPRRTRIGRQPDGPAIDLAAYIEHFANRHADGPVDDRLYEEHRPAHRGLVILVLVDVSASTDSWVGGRLRIIDVEKEALLLFTEALDALGDRFAIHAFSGTGPEAVSILGIKDFDESNGPTVQRRIAGLEPERYTRLGAAIRHATAELARQNARYRLLLVLSDGKPNDIDEYDGRYGIEDARQAIAEARIQGLAPYCLTVDRQAAGYLPRIFGPNDFAVLRKAESLPHVLVGLISRLVSR